MSNTEFMLTVGQANELSLAFRKAGYTRSDVKKMCEGNLLARLLPVIRRNAKIIVTKRIVDHDVNLFIPDGWEVDEHHKNDQLLGLDINNIQLYTSRSQRCMLIDGHELREKLIGKPILNACDLAYLLSHQELIPHNWLGQYIHFFGTVYRDAARNLCVYRLYFDGVCLGSGKTPKWESEEVRLDSCIWGSLAPVAVLTK